MNRFSAIAAVVAQFGLGSHKCSVVDKDMIRRWKRMKKKKNITYKTCQRQVLTIYLLIWSWNTHTPAVDTFLFVLFQLSATLHWWGLRQKCESTAAKESFNSNCRFAFRTQVTCSSKLVVYVIYRIYPTVNRWGPTS